MSDSFLVDREKLTENERLSFALEHLREEHAREREARKREWDERSARAAEEREERKRAWEERIAKEAEESKRAWEERSAKAAEEREERKREWEERMERDKREWQERMEQEKQKHDKDYRARLLDLKRDTDESKRSKNIEITIQYCKHLFLYDKLDTQVTSRRAWS